MTLVKTPSYSPEARAGHWRAGLQKGHQVYMLPDPGLRTIFVTIRSLYIAKHAG